MSTLQHITTTATHKRIHPPYTTIIPTTTTSRRNFHPLSTTTTPSHLPGGAIIILSNNMPLYNNDQQKRPAFTNSLLHLIAVSLISVLVVVSSTTPVGVTQLGSALTCNNGAVSTAQTLSTGTHTITNCVISAAITVTEAELTISGTSSTTALGTIDLLHKDAVLTTTDLALQSKLDIQVGTASITGGTISAGGQIVGTSGESPGFSASPTATVTVTDATFEDTVTVTNQISGTNTDGRISWLFHGNIFIGRGGIYFSSTKQRYLTFEYNDFSQIYRTPGSISTAVIFGGFEVVGTGFIGGLTFSFIHNTASSGAVDIGSNGGVALLNFGSLTSSYSFYVLDVNFEYNTGFAKIVAGGTDIANGASCSSPFSFKHNSATIIKAPDNLNVFDFSAMNLAGCPIVISNNIYQISHSSGLASASAAISLVAFPSQSTSSPSTITVSNNVLSFSTSGSARAMLVKMDFLTGKGAYKNPLSVSTNTVAISTASGAASILAIDGQATISAAISLLSTTASITSTSSTSVTGVKVASGTTLSISSSGVVTITSNEVTLSATNAAAPLSLIEGGTMALTATTSRMTILSNTLHLNRQPTSTIVQFTTGVHLTSGILNVSLNTVTGCTGAVRMLPSSGNAGSASASGCRNTICQKKVFTLAPEVPTWAWDVCWGEWGPTDTLTPSLIATMTPSQPQTTTFTLPATLTHPKTLTPPIIPSVTTTSTSTVSPSSTLTATVSSSPQPTSTQSSTPTISQPPTQSHSLTPTHPQTTSPTALLTQSPTTTNTVGTVSQTSTPVRSVSKTFSQVPTDSPTASPSPSKTPTPPKTSSVTSTPSLSTSVTATAQLPHTPTPLVTKTYPRTHTKHTSTGSLLPTFSQNQTITHTRAVLRLGATTAPDIPPTIPGTVSTTTGVVTVFGSGVFVDSASTVQLTAMLMVMACRTQGGDMTTARLVLNPLHVTHTTSADLVGSGILLIAINGLYYGLCLFIFYCIRRRGPKAGTVYLESGVDASTECMHTDESAEMEIEERIFNSKKYLFYPRIPIIVATLLFPGVVLESSSLLFGQLSSEAEMWEKFLGVLGLVGAIAFIAYQHVVSFFANQYVGFAPSALRDPNAHADNGSDATSEFSHADDDDEEDRDSMWGSANGVVVDTSRRASGRSSSTPTTSQISSGMCQVHFEALPSPFNSQRAARSARLAHSRSQRYIVTEDSQEDQSGLTASRSPRMPTMNTDPMFRPEVSTGADPSTNKLLIASANKSFHSRWSGIVPSQFLAGGSTREDVHSGAERSPSISAIQAITNSRHRSIDTSGGIHTKSSNGDGKSSHEFNLNCGSQDINNNECELAEFSNVISGGEVSATTVSDGYHHSAHSMQLDDHMDHVGGEVADAFADDDAAYDHARASQRPPELIFKILEAPPKMPLTMKQWFIKFDDYPSAPCLLRYTLLAKGYWSDFVSRSMFCVVTPSRPRMCWMAAHNLWRMFFVSIVASVSPNDLSHCKYVQGVIIAICIVHGLAIMVTRIFRIPLLNPLQGLQSILLGMLAAAPFISNTDAQEGFGTTLAAVAMAAVLLSLAALILEVRIKQKERA